MEVVLPGEELKEMSNLRHRKDLFVHRTSASLEPITLLGSKVSGVVQAVEDKEEFVFHFIAEKYLPAVGHHVIGRVIKRSIDAYEVDIRADRSALLGVLSFQGATKKSKPNLVENDLVFAQMQQLPQYLLYKITCTSSKNSKTWNSGEAVFGCLMNGIEVIVPPFFAYFLSKDDCLFEVLRRTLAFEVVIGLNGVIWFKSKSAKTNLLLSAAFKELPYMEKSRAIEFLKAQNF